MDKMEKKFSEAYFDYALKENRIWRECEDKIGEALSNVSKMENSPSGEIYYMGY